jgi:hypothetical protein
LLALALTQFHQQLSYPARGPQFAGDVGGKAQIALRIEPASLDIGRQLTHCLGKGKKDFLDLTRFETPFCGHAAAPPLLASAIH